MPNTLRIKRGLAAGLPNGTVAEPLFTIDTYDLYIGKGDGTNQRFQKYIASGATTQILRGDGSLYSFPLNISSPTNGQVLKYNGTEWVNDSDAAGITGTGASGQVAYWNGTNTQTGSNNLFWDNTNGRLGVGNAAPAFNLDVTGNARVSSTTTFGDIVGIGGLVTQTNLNVTRAITGNTTSNGINVNGQVATNVTAAARYYNAFSSTAAAFTLAELFYYRLQQGTFSGTVTTQYGYYVDSTMTGATNNYGFYGNIAVSGTARWNFYMNGTAPNLINGALSIGSNTGAIGYSSLLVSRNMTGNVITVGVGLSGAVQSDSTAAAWYYNTTVATQATTFTVGNIVHYRADQGTFGLGSTVTTQSGFTATANLIGATNNYGFRGLIPSGTGRWNLYMDGTAINFLSGALLVGSNVDNTIDKLQVSGSGRFSGNVTITNNQNLYLLDTAGNPGFRIINTSSNVAQLFQANNGTLKLRAGSSSNAANAIVFSVGADTEIARFDNSGNLGLGVTPSAWGSGWKVFQFGIGGSLSFTAGANTTIGNNHYFDGTNDIYIQNANALMYRQTTTGQHIFYTSPSGTAGNPITFTQAMTLNASGNLGIGTTSPAARLHSSVSYTAPTGGIDANVQIIASNTSGSSVINMLASNASTSAIHFGDTDDANVGEIAYTHGNNRMLFVTNASINAVLTSGGNLLLGTTTDNGTDRLQVSGSGLFSSNLIIGDTTAPTRLRVKGDSAHTTTISGTTVQNISTFIPSNSIGNITTSIDTATGNAYIWSQYNDSSLIFATRAASVNTARLTINGSTGAATFSSSVTASSLIKSGGTAAQILAADGSVITAGTNITISGGTISTSGISTSSQASYTPTYTNVLNMTSTTGATTTYYIRVGNVVYVNGTINVNATSANTDTKFAISLPVASNFANQSELTGSLTKYNNINGIILADTANDRAEVTFYPTTGNTSGTYTFSFSYIVI